ncbi:MAG: hypothetical protein FWG43_05545 [Clostridiales bacterium]|nr:hypothetical protein [Clostridiales bacterium]
MYIISGLALSITLLIAAVFNNFYLGFPLLVGLLYFMAFSLLKGYSFTKLLNMGLDGAKKAFIVIPILLSLGCLTAMWMAAGTVASFVYYGLSFISPPLFIFIAFISTSALSMLLGSSLGSVGTIGVILIAMAKGGNVNPYIVAGAIISAAVVGDRGSPMASTLHLLSAVTETDIYRIIKMALKTTIGPFLLTALLYLLLSLFNPLTAGEAALRQDMAQYFNLGFLPFVPALVILILCAFKVDIKFSMLSSALSAGLIALLTQGLRLKDIAWAIMWGFEPQAGSSLAGIIHGGGVWAMLKTSFILLIACTLSGILLGIGALDALNKLFYKPCGRFKLYLKTTLLGLVGICCGCNQVIPVVICAQVMSQPYKLNGLHRYDLAQDISLTVLPLAAVIPWCLLSMAATTTLGMPLAHHLPWLFYPLILPLWHGMRYCLSKK